MREEIEIKKPEVKHNRELMAEDYRYFTRFFHQVKQREERQQKRVAIMQKIFPYIYAWLTAGREK